MAFGDCIGGRKISDIACRIVVRSEKAFCGELCVIQIQPEPQTKRWCLHAVTVTSQGLSAHNFHC